MYVFGAERDENVGSAQPNKMFVDAWNGGEGESRVAQGHCL